MVLVEVQLTAKAVAARKIPVTLAVMVGYIFTALLGIKVLFVYIIIDLFRTILIIQLKTLYVQLKKKNILYLQCKNYFRYDTCINNIIHIRQTGKVN